MQLINMEVDRSGTGNRCYLGPFSPGLNVVCGPRGSGKTTLLYWLRQVASERYGTNQAGPQWALPIRGSVELSNRGRTLRAVNYDDGRIDYSGGLAYEPTYDAGGYTLGYSEWLTPIQREALSGLIGASGPADTELELAGLARRLGVDIGEYGKPAGTGLSREQLNGRRSELSRQIRELESLNTSRDELIARRDDLENELSHLRQYGSGSPVQDSEVGRLESRHAHSLNDLHNTNAQLASIESQIAQRQADLKLIETNNCVVEVSQSYREQLQEIDDRLGRWRRTLKDLRAHRASIESNATDAQLDEQVGDELSPTREADPRGALRALEASILASRKQLDDVVGRIGNEPLQASGEYEVVRQPNGETRLVCTDSTRTVTDTSGLPTLLRSMQKDLYEVCQQLARHQSQEARVKLDTQADQLRRAEQELCASIDKLIEERAALLRTIAAEHDLSLDKLTLAEGMWSQKKDHPNLHAWLLQQEASRKSAKSVGSMSDRQRLLDEIESLRSQRRELEIHAEHCKSQLRDSKDYRLNTIAKQSETYSPTAEAELQAQLRRINDDLSLLSQRERLHDELRDVERQLGTPTGESKSLHSDAVTSHIKAMMGRVAMNYADRRSQRFVPRQYDPYDGVVTEGTVEYSTYEAAVPGVIVRLAQRLAIVEALSARGEPVTLILDEVVEQVSPELRGRVVQHLAIVAGRGQQVVLVSADEQLAQMVREQRGWVGYMKQEQPQSVKSSPDLNQHLTAVANEDTAGMWDAPVTIAMPTQRNDYYLTNESLIEDLPSIDASYADRCRSVGVDQIGDLRRADAAWLAEQIDAGPGTVLRWQSEASLLCTVKNLRPFDARVLVGAGIKNAEQLRNTQPGKLLARVEDFMETERGRRILSSGSQYELSRMTEWISAARSNAGRRTVQQYDRSDYSRSDYDRDGDRRGRRSRPERKRSERPERTRSVRSERRSSGRSSRSDRRSRDTGTYSVVSGERGSARNSTVSNSDSRVKYYLSLSSPVVDAPTIGPRMASRLERNGIITVRDLIDADAEVLAEQLDHRRVDADEVVTWQLQAQLVCRIPNLRGHDAQMLVACEISSPEDLGQMSADDVLAQVLEFVQTSEGQRVLRGGKEPDLAEVNDWIAWSRISRSLNAA